VIDVAAAVVADRRADLFRDAGDLAQQILDRPVLQGRIFLQRRVQVGHVRAVMLLVMDPHRQLVDVRFEGVIRIRERGKFVSHTP